MVTFGNIIGIVWVVFILYWILSARHLKPTKVKGKDFTYLRLLGILVVLIIILSLKKFNLVSACRVTWAGCYVGVSKVKDVTSGYLAVAFSIAGLVVAILGRRTLGGNWSTNPEVKKGHELITNGIYSVVRHPIYLGIFLMAIGTCILFRSIIVYLIFIFIFAVFAYRVKLEEELMTKTFPKEYPAYKKRTHALIPFVW